MSRWQCDQVLPLKMLPMPPFAGQQETYLWVQGPDQVCQKVLECWASLYSARAIGYRARFGVANDKLAMAVVIQQMVDSAAAG